MDPKTDATATPSAASDEVEADELVALIQAIKFAYDDYGIKRVHAEIQSHGGKYARVPIKRVRKYMQKLGMTNSEESNAVAAPAAAASEETVVATTTSKKKKKVLKSLGAETMGQQAQAAGSKGAVRVMTVGGSSRSERPSTEATTATTATQGTESAVSHWLPVKLDEPAMKTSEFPYQGVIQMTQSADGASHGRMGEIYKIQMAVGENGVLADGQPMLVYNKQRNRKTFLHVDSPAYAPVAAFIEQRGSNGVVGGAKAFFWGRYRTEEDMLYLNTAELAPFQRW